MYACACACVCECAYAGLCLRLAAGARAFKRVMTTSIRDMVPEVCMLVVNHHNNVVRLQVTRVINYLLGVIIMTLLSLFVIDDDVMSVVSLRRLIERRDFYANFVNKTWFRYWNN